MASSRAAPVAASSPTCRSAASENATASRCAPEREASAAAAGAYRSTRCTSPAAAAWWASTLGSPPTASSASIIAACSAGSEPGSAAPRIADRAISWRNATAGPCLSIRPVTASRPTVAVDTPSVSNSPGPTGSGVQESSSRQRRTSGASPAVRASTASRTLAGIGASGCRPSAGLHHEHARAGTQGVEHRREDLVLGRGAAQQCGHRRPQLVRDVAQRAERAGRAQRVAHAPQRFRPGPLDEGAPGVFTDRTSNAARSGRSLIQIAVAQRSRPSHLVQQARQPHHLCDGRSGVRQPL